MTSTLPPAPSLRNLKNQAKTLLKRHKQGDPGVCDVLRHVRRFAGADDEEILAADVSLVEVQFALAMEYGFGDWKQLKAHVESLQPEGDAPKDELTEAMAGQPGIETLAAIINEGTANSASDTHFEWMHGRLIVRQRIDGALRPSAVEIPEDKQFAVIDRVKIMAALDTQTHDVPQVGRCTWRSAGRPMSARVSVVPYVSGESVVVRYFGGEQPLLGLEAQGLTAENVNKLRQWAARPNGLIVVAGPAGCGKTTTIYSVLRELDSQELKIITAEDPVEFEFEGINQQQIDPSRGMTYAEAIRQQMRQDPDVMMVGECMDLETLDLIFKVALTGHLVFTTMHTNDAPSCLRRMLDLGGDPYSLNSAVIGVLAQRLVRTVCPECSRQYQPEQWVTESLPELPAGPLFRGEGCDSCKGTGYRGRTAVHQLLDMDDGLRTAVARSGSTEDFRQQAAAAGATTMLADGLAKVAKGITTIEEVMRVCGR